MKNVYGDSTKAGRLVIGILILCLGMLSSRKSTANTMGKDSLTRLALKPIRLTEAGARQVLKDRADLIMLQGVIKSQDTLLAQQRQAITQQGQTINQLNQRQQQAQNVGQSAQAQADDCRKRLRAARLENWITRGAVVFYLAVRFKLI